MSTMRWLGAPVLFIGFVTNVALAQSATGIALLLESNRVRFVTAGEALDWRLEVAGSQGQQVFDSSFQSSSALDWSLVDAQGQPIESGFYTYTLTIRATGTASTRSQRGQWLIERAGSTYRVTAINGSEPSDILITVVDNSAGATQELAAQPIRSMPQNIMGPTTFAPAPYISGTGTTGAMTKWLDGPNGLVGDANVTESNGNVVIGNGTFHGNLHIFGGANYDIFSGMGANLAAGPAFNFGYAGASFGRSAGFFNVRPDALASAPNPSLRFMTADVERMIVTNAGRVGIGSSAPNAKLYVEAAETFGVFGRNSSGIGVFGQSLAANSIGVLGRYDGPASNSDGWGVFGYTPSGYAGVFGSSNKNGVYGQTFSASHSGVFGRNDDAGWGVFGFSVNGYAGVFGSSNRNGVFGQTSSGSDSGVFGKNDSAGPGVTGWSLSGDGVVGEAHAGNKSGVYGFTTDGLGCGGCFASYGAGTNRALGVTGNAIQNREGGGLVKAMAYVNVLIQDPDKNKKIVRCYNSQAIGAVVTTPPCGFSFDFSTIAEGLYEIDFGFPVSDRFAVVTVPCCLPRIPALDYGFPTSNAIRISIFDVNGDSKHTPFTIVVF